MSVCSEAPLESIPSAPDAPEGQQQGQRPCCTRCSPCSKSLADALNTLGHAGEPTGENRNTILGVIKSAKTLCQGSQYGPGACSFEFAQVWLGSRFKYALSMLLAESLCTGGRRVAQMLPWPGLCMLS